MTTFHAAVCSSHRPRNVPKMQQLAGDVELTWYVPEAQEWQYQEMRCKVRPVPGAPPLLVQQRNAVLDDAFALGLPALMLDDDLTSLKQVTDFTETRCTRAPITLQDAVERVYNELLDHGLYLGGISPTANWLYVRDKKHLVKTVAFIRDFYVVRPSSPRCDPGLPFTEDYDFNIQHVVQYGGTVRVDSILPTFGKVSNMGGQVSNRKPGVVEDNRRRLAEKWPQYITWPHPKKGPAEVIYRIDGRNTM
jgi:hypothetical protein